MFLHPRTTSLPPPLSFMHFFIFLPSSFIRAFFSFSSLSCSFLPSFLFHTYLSLSRLPFSFTPSFLFHAFLLLSWLFLFFHSFFLFIAFLSLSWLVSLLCLPFSRSLLSLPPCICFPGFLSPPSLPFSFHYSFIFPSSLLFPGFLSLSWLPFFSSAFHSAMLCFLFCPAFFQNVYICICTSMYLCIHTCTFYMYSAYIYAHSRHPLWRIFLFGRWIKKKL